MSKNWLTSLLNRSFLKAAGKNEATNLLLDDRLQHVSFFPDDLEYIVHRGVSSEEAREAVSPQNWTRT